jgi:hypothetical protein
MSNVDEDDELLTDDAPPRDSSQGQWVPPQFPQELQSMARPTGP